jgi:hypothetical protein
VYTYLFYYFLLMTSFSKNFSFFFLSISFLSIEMYQQPSIDMEQLLIKARTAHSSHTPVLLFYFFFPRRFCHLPASDETSITISSTRLYLKHIRALTPSVFVPSNYYWITFNFSLKLPVNILNKTMMNSSEFGFLLDLFGKYSPRSACLEQLLTL